MDERPSTDTSAELLTDFVSWALRCVETRDTDSPPTAQELPPVFPPLREHVLEWVSNARTALRGVYVQWRVDPTEASVAFELEYGRIVHTSQTWLLRMLDPQELLFTLLVEDPVAVRDAINGLVDATMTAVARRLAAADPPWRPDCCPRVFPISVHPVPGRDL